MRISLADWVAIEFHRFPETNGADCVMSLFRFFSPTLVLRFVAAIRQDGLGAAIAKALEFVARNRADRGPTALAGVGGRPDAGHAYLLPLWRELASLEAFHVASMPAMLRKTRRIAMIGDLNLPQCRKYRVEQLAEFWNRQGVEYSYAHYRDPSCAVELMQNATHLMLYRAFNHPLMSMYFYEARRLRLPVLYDLDDPLFSIAAYETYGNMNGLPKRMKEHFLNEAPKYLDAMNLADIITMSTPALVEHAKLYTRRPVHYRRNFADEATFAASATTEMSGRSPDEGFRVAFTSGSMGHEMDFAMIEKDIVKFLAAAPNRTLSILGHFDEKRLPRELHERVEKHEFASYENYLANLALADCAVMPLTDDIFNRCKSAVRVIDAAAVKVPAVVGEVCDMANMVRNGETGRVLAKGENWADALEELAVEKGAPARKLGEAAHNDLAENWTGRPTSKIVEPEILDWVMS